MHNLKKKMKKQGGFTLIEMLIVVAIIAILVAVSIPVVNNALERARRATDAANERAAKAATMICYLNGKLEDGTTEFKADTTYYYDANAGKLLEDVPTNSYGKCSDHSDGYLKVTYSTTAGEVVLEWQGASKSDPHNGVIDNTTTATP